MAQPTGPVSGGPVSGGPVSAGPVGIGPVLAFDTSAAHCAAAIVSGDAILACRIEAMGRGQAERLMPLLADLLREAGLAWSDLAALGVGTGPGNFTGIRIAVAASRGLALASGRPAIGVTGLEAAALDLPRPLVAAIPAPRGRFYLQGFGTSQWADPALVDPEETALPVLPATGPAAADLARLTGAAVLQQAHALPVAIARLAAARASRPAPPRPAPLYLRPADAAPPREAPPRLLP